MRLRVERHQKTEANAEQFVTCEECGHRGPLREFLSQDPGDTTCPKCGADQVLYEL